MRAPRVLAALLLVGGLALAGGPPAQAGTMDSTAPKTLQIVVDDIKPLAPVAASTLTVSVTVTNSGTTPVSSMSVALDNGGAAQSRQALGTFEAAPAPGDRVLTMKALPKGLAAGASTEVLLKVPLLGQVLTEASRVYELTVVASGALTSGGAIVPQGVVALPLPYFPVHIMSPLRTALIIPMTAVPDQGPAPQAGAPSTPPSPALIQALTAPNGRLAKLLTVVEAAPAADGIHGTQLTLALDPALVKRVCALAGKCGLHPAQGTPAADTQIASTWLVRLSNAVNSPDVAVVGLPYADADIGAMTAFGDTGTVISDLKAAGSEVDRELATASTTTDLQPLLPVDGLADDALASAGKQAGSTVTVLSSAEFQPPTPTATGPVTATANTRLETSAGSLPVLVTDNRLEDMLSPMQSTTSSARLQEQDLLAELAVITSEQPNDLQQRTVVLEAPRDWDVPATFSSRLVDALGFVTWVKSDSLETIQGAFAPPRERVTIPPQPATTPLPASTIATVDNARSTVSALADVAADPANETVSQPFGEGLDRALSAWWRFPYVGQGAAELASVTNKLTNIIKQVTVKGGTHGVLLTGPSGTLPVQVQNGLNEPIAVIVHIKSDGLDQVTGRDAGPYRLDAGSAPLQVSVPITTRSTRNVAVTVQLLARSTGAPVTDATVQVRSTSVGKVAVGITAAALTLLVLLIVFRAGRRIAANRRGEPSA